MDVPHLVDDEENDAAPLLEQPWQAVRLVGQQQLVDQGRRSPEADPEAALAERPPHAAE